MMKLKKIFYSLIVLVVVILSSCFGAFAITTDGVLTESEWRKAPATVLTDQRSFNNKIKSAVVKTVEDRKNGYIYLAVMVEFEKSGNIKDGAIKLSINGSESVFIKIGGEVENKSNYSIKAGSDFDINTYSSATEISLFFKNGLSSSETFKISIVDLNGTESGVYTVKVEEKTTTTTTTTTKPTTEKTTKPTTEKTTKPTTEKTTKPTTEKTTTTKTSKSTSTTTKTSRSTTTKTSEISSASTKESSDEKTEHSSKSEKESKTKKSTTTKEAFTFKKVVKSTTTKADKKEKPKKSTAKTSSGESSAVIKKERTDPSSEILQAEEYVNLTEETSDNGKNKKMVYVAIGAVGALVIAAAAVTAAVKSNKKDDK